MWFVLIIFFNSLDSWERWYRKCNGDFFCYYMITETFILRTRIRTLKTNCGKIMFEKITIFAVLKKRWSWRNITDEKFLFFCSSLLSFLSVQLNLWDDMILGHEFNYFIFVRKDIKIYFVFFCVTFFCSFALQWVHVNFYIFLP